MVSMELEAKDMGKVYKSPAELIGKTPLLELTNYTGERYLSTPLFSE
jgi:hypothetical protein